MYLHPWAIVIYPQFVHLSFPTPRAFLPGVPPRDLSAGACEDRFRFGGLEKGSAFWKVKGRKPADVSG
jgi:hypothetical protein